MTRLSVNVNKIATLRNARGGQEPNVVEAATRIQAFGADGITVHPRPDARHITYQDVHDLREVVHTEFNVEGYPSDDFVKLVCDAKPEQVTLVPDPPHVLTSNAGWTVTDHADLLKNVLAVFKAEGIRTSLFIETDEAQIHAAADVGAKPSSRRSVGATRSRTAAATHASGRRGSRSGSRRAGAPSARSCARSRTGRPGSGARTSTSTCSTTGRRSRTACRTSATC